VRVEILALAGGGLRPLARSRVVQFLWRLQGNFIPGWYTATDMGNEGGTAELSFVPCLAKDFLFP
jgi:hypothetical protein